MGGEQDGGLLADRQQDVQDLLTAQGVEGGGGLVANQELRAAEEGLGDAQPLLHAAGEASHAVGLLPQSHQLQKLVTAFGSLSLAHTADGTAEVQVLGGGHEGVEFGDVGKVADMAVGGGLAVDHPLAVHEDLASVGLQKPQNRLHGGGLPRAVLADEAEDAVFGDGEIQSAQDLLVTEAFAESADAQHIHHESSLPRRK